MASNGAGQITASIVLGGMDAVERSLKAFSRSMDTVARNAQQMGSKLRNAGEGMKGLGSELAPLTAGFVALGTAGVMASSNIEEGLNNFQTKLGATGSELAQYEQIMNDVAKTGVGNFNEVSNSVVTLAKNMKGLTPDDLTMLTEEAMQLASVMGTDVQDVSKVAGQMMKQFGINGAEAMDLIAKGYQNGMDYSGDYLDTLNEYSVYFKSLGFDAEDMFNVLAEGAENGAFNLDKVGDAVKEFGIRSKDGSKASSEAFQALGLDAGKLTETFAKGGDGAKEAYAKVVNALTEVDDQTKRNEIGVALFGTQYEDMEKDVIASTGSIVDHMKNVEGASAEVAQNNKTFSQQMQGAWNEIQTAIAPVGDVIKDAILTVMPYVMKAVKGLSDAFTGLSPNTQKVVIGLGGLVALAPMLLIGLGSMLSIIGSLVSSFGAVARGVSTVIKFGGKLVTAFKKIWSAIKILRVFLVANPFIAIATGLFIVVGLVIKYWDEISAGIQIALEAIGAFFAPFWEGLKEVVANVTTALLGYWDTFKAGFMSIFNAISSFVGAVWEVIKTIFLIGIGILLTIIAPIYNGFVTIFNAIVSVVGIVWNKIKAGATLLWSAINAGLTAVKAFFSVIWNAIYSSVIAPVIARIKAIVATITAFITTVLNRVKAVFTAIWNAIYNAVIAPAIAKIKSAIETIKEKVTAVTTAVKSVFTTAFNAVKDKVSSNIDSIKDKITGIWDKASDVAGKIKGAFSNLFGNIKVPSFSMGGWTMKDLPKLPKMKVQWNANGGILDSATMIGAGEKGAEAIVPLSSQRRMKPFAQAVSKFMPESARGGAGKTEINVAQLVVREEADIEKVAKELNRLSERKERAKGGIRFNG